MLPKLKGIRTVALTTAKVRKIIAEISFESLGGSYFEAPFVG